MLDLSKVKAALERGFATIQALEPLAGIGGPAVAQAAAIAGALAEIGQNALKVISDGQEVVSSGDESRIREILADIQAENDRLAGIIARG